MLDMFADAFEDPDSYTSRQPDDVYLAQLLASDSFVAIAAMSADRSIGEPIGGVVGGIIGYILRKCEQPRSELYIYDLAVREQFRRRGIATSLIRAMGEVAVSKDIELMYVQAHQADEPAISLYSRWSPGQEVVHFELETSRKAR
jgi:aminoglycoside 3-N-acetyltransferase I